MNIKSGKPTPMTAEAMHARLGKSVATTQSVMTELEIYGALRDPKVRAKIIRQLSEAMHGLVDVAEACTLDDPVPKR